MTKLSKNDARFFNSFKDNMDQYPVSEMEFLAFLNGNSDAITSESYTGLCDARNLWADAVSPLLNVCRNALTLLKDTEASDYDADKVTALLESVLKEVQS